jgi:sigma-B regulation protein RsbU (phosphoserine phosphatase)
MADVSGHGAASAFVTVMLRTLIIQYRDALWQAGDDTILHPQQILTRANRDLCRQNLEKHLTLFFGVIDLEQNTMRYSNGGQYPYPLHYDGSEVRALECPGRPLGLFEDAEFRGWQHDLPRECALVLVSDGVLELMSEDAMLKRYSALLAGAQGTDTVLDEMTAGLDVLADQHLPDDIAFLVISRNRSDG